MLGISELLGFVLAEISLEKTLGFRKSEVEVGQRLHTQLQIGRGTVEEMSAVLAVLGDEVEMISRNAALEKPGDHKPTSVPSMLLK